MDPVRVGIIGVGQIGKAHIQRYRDVADAQVVAIADVNEAELTRVSKDFGIADTYKDYADLLARDDIQAVDVCLHNRLHAPVSIEALEAGKHVYCEKPIAGSYAEGKSMLDAAAAADRMLHIQLATLYSMETKTAKRLIDAGELGKIYHARAFMQRRRGRPFVDGYATPSFVQKEVAAGGALLDIGIYTIAQILYLLGLPEVARISGKTYQELAMDEARRATSGYDVEEFAVGLVRFANGATLDILTAWAANMSGGGGNCVYGSQGGVMLDPFGFFKTLADIDMDASINLKGQDSRWHRMDDTYDAYDSQHHHWIAALQGRVPLQPTAELALNTMLIQEGIYLSDARGREVTAEEVVAQSGQGT